MKCRRLLASGILCVIAGFPCRAEEGVTPDQNALHIGLSLSIVADFYNLPPDIYPARGELYVRYQAWESTVRCDFRFGSHLDISLDARLAPRVGAYLPACGLGVQVFSSSWYNGAGVFLSAVPCRFDVGPLIEALLHRRCPEVLLSTFEIRFGSVVPELFSPGLGFSSHFIVELTLLRVGIGI